MPNLKPIQPHDLPENRIRFTRIQELRASKVSPAKAQRILKDVFNIFVYQAVFDKGAGVYFWQLPSGPGLGAIESRLPPLTK